MQFWTLYHRNDEGLSEGIIDCMFREDAEAALRVYEQRDALAAENAALKSAIVIAKEGLQEHYDTDGVDSQDNEGNFMDACIRLCDAQSTIEKLEDILTPAIDAYLNSVRADAVASFAHHQRVIADSETDPTIQRGHRITACRAEDFAAQLRAGKDGE